MARNATQKTLSLVLVGLLAGISTVAWAAEVPAQIEGTVMHVATKAPAPHVVVRAEAIEGSTSYQAKTDAEGAFTLAGITAGDYQLGVQTDRGVYVVEKPVRLDPGQARWMRIDVVSLAPAQTQASKTKFAPVIGAASVVVLGFALNALNDQNDEPERTASPARLP